MVRDQQLAERREYTTNLETMLIAKGEEASMDEIRTAILTLDPHKIDYPKTLHAYISRGFTIPYSKIKPDEKVKSNQEKK